MSFSQQFMPPQAAVQAPAAPAFYPTNPAPPPFQPAPFQPAPFVQVQAPQFKPGSWAPPAPVQQFQPQRVPVMAAPIPAFQPQQQMPQQQMAGMPMHFQVPNGLTHSNFGYYGYAPDQMWSALAAVPPMWRPQQPGETFMRRWGANTFLNMIETVLQQGLIGVRQIYLPPTPGQQQQHPTVDAL